jgi:steroid 5-alpha reductase family enzyme
MWVTLTSVAALTAITTQDFSPLGWLDACGLLTWGAGLMIEVAADHQKRVFRGSHLGRFIDTGLWSRSRHPNYFGEILLWVGVALCASSTLAGPQWVAWISPVFVTVLLTRISGIPMLEQRAQERWGDDPAYQAYRDRTPVLIPRLRRRTSGPLDGPPT